MPRRDREAGAGGGNRADTLSTLPSWAPAATFAAPAAAGLFFVSFYCSGGGARLARGGRAEGKGGAAPDWGGAEGS